MFFLIPTNENGIVIDPYAATNLRLAAKAETIEDVFIYSHGWWTSALDAMISYNRFGAGLISTIEQPGGKSSLAIGIHWPSTLSENARDWINLAEGASFYTMEKRADEVGAGAGAALLRMVLAQSPRPTRIHLIGHSFGCKVICAAIQHLIENSPAEIYAGIDFNLVLLQPAFEDNSLSATHRYARLATEPRLRILITKSAQDTALCIHFPRAHALEFFDREDRTALGATGPSQSTVQAFGGAQMVNEESPGCTSGAMQSCQGRLIVADLSVIHRQRAAAGLYLPNEFSGQHSDIYFDQIYRLIASFLRIGFRAS